MSLENFNEAIEEQDDDDHGFDITNFYITSLTRSEIFENTTGREQFFENVEDLRLGDIIRFNICDEIEESSEDLHLAELRKLVELEIDDISEEFIEYSGELPEILEKTIDYEINAEGSIRSDIYFIDQIIWDETEYLGEIDDQKPIKGFEPAHPLADLSDDEIIKITDKLRIDIKHLQLENQIFLNVLQQDEPSIFENVDNFVENRLAKDYRLPKSIHKIRIITNDNEESVTFAQKTDLVLHEIQEIKTKLNILKKRSHQSLSNLKAEIQEINARKSELKTIIDSFDNSFNLMDDAGQQTIKKIPVEKFVCFIQNSIRRIIIATDKIRLDIGSLKKQYKKASLLVKQKQQIGEDIHPVDLQLLQIERERLQKEIELKNILLKDLHGMNGNANLSLSNQSKELLKIENHLKEIQKSIAVKATKIARLQKECGKAVKELQRCDEIKQLSKI